MTEKTLPVWNQTIPPLDTLNQLSKDTMLEHLDIRFTEIGDDYVTATMPVDHRTVQPMRILHGGASLVLAESLGSMAAHYCVDATKQACVGLEINANHIRSVHSGLVTGTARPIHIGRRTQVWEIRMEDDQGRLTCIARLTMAVLEQ